MISSRGLKLKLSWGTGVVWIRFSLAIFNKSLLLQLKSKFSQNHSKLYFSFHFTFCDSAPRYTISMFICSCSYLFKFRGPQLGARVWDPSFVGMLNNNYTFVCVVESTNSIVCHINNRFRRHWKNGVLWSLYSRISLPWYKLNWINFCFPEILSVYNNAIT